MSLSKVFLTSLRCCLLQYLVICLLKFQLHVVFSPCGHWNCILNAQWSHNQIDIPLVYKQHQVLLYCILLKYSAPWSHLILTERSFFLIFHLKKLLTLDFIVNFFSWHWYVWWLTKSFLSSTRFFNFGMVYHWDMYPLVNRVIDNAVFSYIFRYFHEIKKIGFI